MTAVDLDENTAVGLVWGLLEGGQFDDAAGLADAARLVWPQSGDLQMLSAWSRALASPTAAAPGPADLQAPAATDTQGELLTPDPSTHDLLAADPRWNTLLATLHQRERLRDEHRREEPSRDAHRPIDTAPAVTPSHPRSGR
jgi:hypothetical protein